MPARVLFIRLWVNVEDEMQYNHTKQKHLTQWDRGKKAIISHKTLPNEIIFNETVSIWIRHSLMFVPKAPIHNIQELIQIMVWRRPSDKPLLNQWWLDYWRTFASFGRRQGNMPTFMGPVVYANVMPNIIGGVQIRFVSEILNVIYMHIIFFEETGEQYIYHAHVFLFRQR